MGRYGLLTLSISTSVTWSAAQEQSLYYMAHARSIDPTPTQRLARADLIKTRDVHVDEATRNEGPQDGVQHLHREEGRA